MDKTKEIKSKIKIIRQKILILTGKNLFSESKKRHKKYGQKMIICRDGCKNVKEMPGGGVWMKNYAGRCPEKGWTHNRPDSIIIIIMEASVEQSLNGH